MDKKYKVRHALLGALQARLSKFGDVSHLSRKEIQHLQMTPEAVSSVTGYLKTDLINQADYLLLLEEVSIYRTGSNIEMSILAPGSVAYFDSKYLQEGRKVFWSNLFDVAKTISTVVLLIFAVITFITGILRSQRTEEDIRGLKQEVETLKHNQLSRPLLKPRPASAPIVRKPS
jgi:uncharacterized BrkB/YihY/UPF0761 family membrane protein